MLIHERLNLFADILRRIAERSSPVLAPALVGFFAGVAFLAKQNSNAPLIAELNENLAHDRQFVIVTLHRELANYMVRLDPDRYLNLYWEVRAADIAIQNASKQSQEQQPAEINGKYPFYEDFDLIGTREHVPYADALSIHSIEEIEPHLAIATVLTDPTSTRSG